MFNIADKKSWFLISDLHQLHENWLVKGENLVPKAPVRIIDANGDLDQLREKYQAETNRILYKNQNKAP